MGHRQQESSINVRNNSIRNHLFVLLPVLAVPKHLSILDMWGRNGAQLTFSRNFRRPDVAGGSKERQNI